MNNRFLQTSLGLAAIIFASAFFVRSIAPAHAAPSPQEFLDEGTNKIGKYQMAPGLANDPDQIYYNVLVWDTETGKRQMYNYNRNTLSWNAWKNNLPDEPLK